MRSVFFSLSILWVAMSLEIASNRQVPGGSLLLPIAWGICFWFRNSTGLLIAGIGMLVDCVIRPAPVPLTAIMLPLLAAAVLAPRGRVQEHRRQRSLFKMIPAAIHLPLLTVVSLISDQVARTPLTAYTAWPSGLTGIWDNMLPSLIIALPLSAVIALGLRLADELGLRQSRHRVTL